MTKDQKSTPKNKEVSPIKANPVLAEILKLTARRVVKHLEHVAAKHRSLAIHEPRFAMDHDESFVQRCDTDHH